MTGDASFDELAHRLDRIEADLGSRVAVLERLVLSSPTEAVSPPPSAVSPPPTAVPPQPTGVPSLTQLPPPSTSPPSPSPPAPPPPAPPPPSPADARFPVRPPAASGPQLKLEDVLRIVGVALVGLAALFLVSTAISRGWIGPELQLLGATLIGLGLSAGAVFQTDRRRPWAVTLGIGGAAVTSVCAGAAHAWLDLVAPVPALGLVAAAAAFSVVVAVRVRSEAIAIASSAALLLVPPFADIVSDAPVSVVGTWLGLFAVAAAVIGVTQGWQIYRLVSTWATGFWVFVLAGVLFDQDNTDNLALGACLVAVVGAVLWLGPMLNERLLQSETVAGFGVSDRQRRTLATEHRLVALIPLWAWQTVVFLGALTVNGDGAAVALALAVGFGAMAVAARRLAWISEFGALSHLLGAGLLLTIGLVSWLDGPTLVVALAAQALITVVVANRFDDLIFISKGVALAGLVWLLLIVDLVEVIEAGVESGSGSSIGSHLARALTVVALGITGRLLGRSRARELTEVVNGLVWLAAVLFPVSVIAPVVEEPQWLVVAAVVSVVSLVAARALGRFVLAIGAIVGALSVVVAAANILEALFLGLDGDAVTVTDHLSHLSVVVALAVVTAWCWTPRTGRPDWLAVPLFLASWVLSLGWLASIVAGLPQAQAAISAVWAVAAVGGIVVGLVTGRSEVRTVGLVTLGVVLVKLLTVDLAEVDTLWRVGLFLAIGLGLLRLAYVLPDLAARYAPVSPEADGESNTDGESKTDGESNTDGAVPSGTG